MNITVNDIICNTEEEIKEALKWENQKGEYAQIIYHEAEPTFDAKGKINGLRLNGEYFDIPQKYTMRNWYNSNEKCTYPNPNVFGRCFSKELSYNENIKRILNQIRKDLKELN